ncbi:MAG: peptide ABC transporter substrate-binding protein [Thermoleophilia bacterium]|nr:peptide ABC transporter substrate-binding protein [Thermoleophilia bacterium]
MRARIRLATAACVAGVATLGVASTALGNVTHAQDQAPPILNNALADGNTVVGQRVVGGTIFENLFTANSQGRNVALLATKVPSGSDIRLRGRNFSVRFSIQPAARWSDGRPVTADDVIFTWRTYTNPNNQVSSRTGWEEIRSITKQGAKNFTVNFKRPYAPWQEIFSIGGGSYLFPRHILQGKDFNTVWNNGPSAGAPFVGSGPYVLASYTADEQAVLRPNTRYWRTPKPRAGTITHNFVGSTTTAVVQLRTGESNLITPPPSFDLFPQIRAIANTRLQSRSAASWEQLAFNVQAAPLNDRAVRQAIAYAIDRKGVTTDLLGGQVSRLDSALVPLQFGYKPSFAKYTYQPERAKQILRQAGWTQGSDGIFSKGGQRLSLTVKTTAGNVARQRNIQYWTVKARAAGVELVYTPEPASKLFGGTLTNGDYQVANFAFSGSFDPSLTSILVGRQIPTQANDFSGQNYYRYAGADALLNASDEAVDTTRRRQLLGQIQDRLANDVPFLPLYARPNTVAHNRSIAGPDVNPTQAEIYWNVNRWVTGRS